MKISFGWEATYPKSFCLICTIFAPGQTSTVALFSAQGAPAYLNKESPITNTPADDRHPIEYESEPASPEVQQTPKSALLATTSVTLLQDFILIQLGLCLAPCVTEVLSHNSPPLWLYKISGYLRQALTSS
ncbi:hypothetical protein J6590_048229 [Homalodisca vitripennis]|nr:hypothetical protein J6590_048229 [Homalodisca vitripennis]